MTASAERGANALLDDFLAYTLAGTRPSADDSSGLCAGGNVRWTWLDDGVLQLEPSVVTQDTRSVLTSAGIHGDETAPIELLSLMVRDIAAGRAELACRLLVIFGNVNAMRESCRYRDDDLNRLFSGRHAQVPQSHEAPRAAALENVAKRFFAGASNAPEPRLHIDIHP